MSSEENLSEDHPLSAELASLRRAVVQFQDEAHHASVKLQRQSLDISNAHDRVAYFERQNEALESELEALRANPHPESLPQSHPAVYQSQQLTLSLRRLSDKLSLTEQALLDRTAELTFAVGEATKAKLAEDNAYALASRIRGREEAGKSRELELEMKVKAAEEAAKMSDLVVQEYADLVRSLQGNPRSSKQHNGSAHAKSASITSDAVNVQANAPLHSLTEGKAGLQRLVADFSASTEKLESELTRAQAELSESESKLEAERKALEQCRQELAKTRFELQQLKLEDNTAARMVSRYMTFSQKSNEVLQETIATLKTRHEATTDSLSEQIANLVDQLEFFEGETEKLRHALDELSGELMKESFGRRREVALRIRMVSREEKLREDLEKWVLKAEEALTRNPEDLRTLYETMVGNARQLLDFSFGGASETSRGTVARITIAESAVEMLMEELEKERRKHIHLANLLSKGQQLPEVRETQEAARAPEVVPPARETPLLLQKPLPPDPQPSLPVTPGGSDKDLAESLPTQATQPEEAPLAPLHPQISDSMPSVAPEASEEPPSNDTHPLEVTPSNDQALSPLPQEANLPAQLPDVVDDKSLNAPAPTTNSPPRSTSVPEQHEPASVPAPVPSSSEAATSPPADLVLNEKTISVDQPSDIQDDETPAKASKDEEEVAAMLLEDRPLSHVHLVEDTISVNEPPASFADVSDNKEIPVPITLSQPQVVSAEKDSTSDIPKEQESMPPKSDETKPPTISAPSIPSLLFTDADVEVTKKPIPSVSIPDSPIEQISKPSAILANPLLAELANTSHRYDDLQRGFRDCHRSLETLKETLKSPPTTSRVDPELLRAAAKRLAEWNEDARVELEIRAADEELVARGYEALLSIPGALASPGLTPLPSARTSALLGEDSDRAPNTQEVEAQVRAFISGEDPTVRKAFSDLSQKLADIEHDIAALQRSMHEEVLDPLPSAPVSEPPQSSGWTSWIRNSPSTPSGLNTPPALGSASGPVPTFGNIMSSPRLRHSPSLNLQQQQRRVSGNGPTGADPFASLGLKVPMPTHLQPRITDSTPQRPRTISSMYMLGLGARSSTSAFASASPRGAFTPRKSPFNVISPPPQMAPEHDDDDNDSDIE